MLTYKVLWNIKHSNQRAMDILLGFKVSQYVSCENTMTYIRVELVNILFSSKLHILRGNQTTTSWKLSVLAGENKYSGQNEWPKEWLLMHEDMAQNRLCMQEC
jgi:hypothetical protein